MNDKRRKGNLLREAVDILIKLDNHLDISKSLAVIADEAEGSKKE